MSLATFRIGLRHCAGRPTSITSTSNAQLSISSLIASRHISSISISQSRTSLSTKPTKPPFSAISSSSLFGTRYASTASDSITATAHPPRAPVLNWNSFFSLRTSRRRYSLASSIVSSIVVTGAAFVFLSTQPEMADEVTKLIPMDPVVSMGILTFAATFMGWLIGPIFGNTVWKLFHRSRLPEFTVKEKAFFERIKKHRVNPMGASTNNPVPDYYGEKIGSVQGYRRWLRDQRAFNRKREGSYPGGI